MPYLQCTNINIYYEEEGDGVPLVLLPGLGCDCRVWGGVRNRLARVYRVIMPDIRGMGRSEYDGKPFTIEQMAADMAEFIKLLDISKAVVCGHSMGGQVALQFSADYPELVSHLVLTCTDAHLGEATCELLRGWADTRCTDGDIEGWLREVYRWMVTEKYYNSSQLEAAVKYGINAEVYKTDDDFRRQFLATADFDIRSRLGNVDIPVLIIAGMHDLLFPIERQKELAKMLPEARLEILEECAHSPLMESSGEFVNLLLDLASN